MWVATPNDPKLSDGGGWRGPCMAGGKAAAEARAVTAVAVRCSAWLGVAVILSLTWAILSLLTACPIALAAKKKKHSEKDVAARHEQENQSTVRETQAPASR